jgi:hypothetical protein
MGTVTYDDGAAFRLDDADATTNWVDWGTSPTQEGDYRYQGSFCVSCQVKKSEVGMYYLHTSTTDMTTPKAWIAKIIQTNKDDIDGNGLWLAIGSDDANFHTYYVYPTGGDYPIAGGWQIIPIDPNEAGFIGLTTGTPLLGTADLFGIQSDAVEQAKSPNLGMDAVDIVTVGSGWTVTGSSSTFQDFVDADEGAGDADNDRTGLVTTREGIIYVFGVLTIGSSTATAFDDSNQVIVFPEGRFGEGFSGVDIDLQNASTDVDIASTVFKGNGKPAIKKFFDTALEVVGGGTDTITLLSHGYESADYVQYLNEGGSDDIGLTTTNYYWVYVVDIDTIAMHASRASALADTTRIDLTAGSAPGENQSLTRDSDNRPDLSISGTSGLFDTDACTLDGFRIINLTSACTLNGGFVINSGNLNISDGELTGVAVAAPTLEEGNAFLDPLTTIADIVGCDFTAGDEGHAIRLTSSAGSPFTSDANKYTDYWAPTTDGWNFHTQTGVDDSGEVITTDANHGFIDGEAVYYNNEGGTDTIGLTDEAKYYVNYITDTTLSIHLTKAAAVADSSRIDLTDGATGEIHSLYSGRATLFNDSGGSVTINIANSGDAPSIRNGTDSSTTVSSPVFHTLTNLVNGTEVTYMKFGSAEDTGTTGETTTDSRDFDDSGKSWSTNQYRGRVLIIEEGADAGRYYIYANSATQLNLDTALTATASTLDYSIQDENDMTEEFHVESVTGNQSQHAYNYTGDAYVDIMIQHVNYEEIVLLDILLGNSDQTLPQVQLLDVNYYNPT